MAMTVTMLRLEKGVSPGLILEKVNRNLCAHNSYNMFVTVFIAIVQRKTGLLTFSNAGHNFPFILKNNGQTVELDKKLGIPLGIFPDSHFREEQITLESGDLLFMFTDGVTEAENRVGDMFTKEALIAALKECSGKNSEETVSYVHEKVQEFSAGNRQSDDVTIAAVTLCNPSE